ncbi:MAG TPA: hypothetical protein DCS15_07700 [Flavobacteriales bacterium]|jgi:type IX secretion system PorP/SprF family membrane protein|nr:type IX secretion system membrane protein PorP/SprF [Salibacteraceae bacterium]HAS36355.1 hypothetical protein [Flavobacteriales bacterium]
MRGFLTIVCLLIIGLTSKAQQLPHFTQYLINSYVTNPAIGGTDSYFKAQSNHRYQWAGINDAPRTYVFSLQGPIIHQKMGLGGYMFTDFTGPTRRSGFQASYSYILNVTSDIRLSFGISGGVLQFLVDGGKVNLENLNDVVLSNTIQSVIVPDIGGGLYLYHKDWFVSLSAPQLVGSKLQFFENFEETQARLSRHFFASAGYNFHITDEIDVQPSFFMKFVDPTPLQVDASVRAIYQEKVWFGVSYRSEDAFGVLLGFDFLDNFMLGYSYDLPINGLARVSSGSHELMVGFKFKSRD